MSTVTPETHRRYNVSMADGRMCEVYVPKDSRVIMKRNPHTDGRYGADLIVYLGGRPETNQIAVITGVTWFYDSSAVFYNPLGKTIDFVSKENSLAGGGVVFGNGLTMNVSEWQSLGFITDGTTITP